VVAIGASNLSRAVVVPAALFVILPLCLGACERTPVQDETDWIVAMAYLSARTGIAPPERWGRTLGEALEAPSLEERQRQLAQAILGLQREAAGLPREQRLLLAASANLVVVLRFRPTLRVSSPRVEPAAP
jgi:hypothetical protein